MAPINYRFRQSVDLPNATYLTHGIHHYPARFIPHIPHWFIARYGAAGQTLLDPFAGSGTALVEASLQGLHGVAIDLNPLTPLLLQAKTEVPTDMRRFAKLVRHGMAAAQSSRSEWQPPLRNLDKWFGPQARHELGRIFGYLQTNPDDLPPDVINFLKVCASAAVRPVCNADPKVSKPFVSRQRRAALAKGSVPQAAQIVFERRVRGFLRRKWAYVRALEQRQQVGGWAAAPTIRCLPDGDARQMTALNDNSIDLMITSPPYANAQEYLRSVKFELFWLGAVDVRGLRALDAALIGSERLRRADYDLRSESGLPDLDVALAQIYKQDPKRAEVVYRYFLGLQKVLAESLRVLKPGGMLGVLVGNNVIRGVPLATHAHLLNLAEQVGFQVHEVGYDPIHIRALGPQRAEWAGWIDREWLLTLKKP